jgi:hypothetical protein
MVCYFSEGILYNLLLLIEEVDSTLLKQQDQLLQTPYAPQASNLSS